MLVVWFSLFYLMLHLVAYTVFFRHRAVFRTERGIFLLHAVSASLLTLAAFALAIDQGLRTALLAAVASGAAHGIYSMSFLELWSLSQGSYSFLILHAIQSRQPALERDMLAELGAVGDGKKDQRLQSLARLQLLDMDGETVRLTHRGRRVAASLRSIQRIANLSETG